MPPMILPVIHHKDDTTTLSNAKIVAEADCPGIFLIQMNGQDAQLNEPAKQIKKTWPHLLVGINRLRSTPDISIIMNTALGLDMTWSDNCGITSGGASPTADAISHALKKRPRHKFFGSVAFKYQTPEPDPGQAAKNCADRGWIATTSGVETGTPPDLAKIISMKEAIGNRPLAVASGITPQNALLFLKYLEYILVATGIGSDFYNIDPKKLRQLVSSAREYSL